MRIPEGYPAERIVHIQFRHFLGTESQQQVKGTLRQGGSVNFLESSRIFFGEGKGGRYGRDAFYFGQRFPFRRIFAGEDQQADDEQTQEADTEDEGESEPASLWDDDKLTKDYEVNITGTTAYEAVQSMVEAGIFKDYSEYQKICGENGYDHEKMRAGVFTFKKGSTKLDIIKIVNWSKG